jgi:hypothetical protein
MKTFTITVLLLFTWMFNAFSQSDSAGVFRIYLDSVVYKDPANIKTEFTISEDYKAWLKKTVGSKKKEEILFFFYINDSCKIDSVTFVKDYGSDISEKLKFYLEKYQVEAYQNKVRLHDCTVLQLYYPMRRIAARLKYF